MKRPPKSSALRISISRKIVEDGFCLIAGPRLSALHGKRAERNVKLEQLYNFARSHGVRVKPLRHGRGAMFYEFTQVRAETN